MKACREVEAICGEVDAATAPLLKMSMLGRIVASGDSAYTCTLHPTPDPCLFLDADIQVRRSPPTINLVERDGAAVLRLRGRSLIYDPKIIKIVMSLVVSRLREGKPPISNLILAGYPGTGKTELARAVAELSGANLFELDATQIMSKWVGESAKRLARAVGRAMMEEPSIVAISDVDTISAGGSRTESAENNAPYVEVRSVLINKMDEARNRAVAFIITTNRSLNTIDPAIKRRSVTIIMSPPTPSMINAYIEEASGVVGEAIKAWGREAVRSRVMGLAAGGATWGVLDSTLRMALALNDLNADTSDLSGLGYSFLTTATATPLPDTAVREEMRRKLPLERPVRIVPAPSITAASSPTNDAFATVAAMSAAISSGKLIIQVTRADYAEDAAATAQQVNAALLVPPTIPPQVRATLMNYPIPIIMTRAVDDDSRSMIHIIEPSDAAAHYMLKLAAALYGVQCSDAPVKNSRIQEALHIMSTKRIDCSLATMI
ncbi:MAG: AAA family ATPase [Thermocladium sp.]